MLALLSLSASLALPKSPDILLSSGFLCFSSHAGALQALEAVGLIVVFYFMYDVWVLMVVEYNVEDPNFQFRDPPPDPWGSIILYGTMTFFGGGHLCTNFTAPWRQHGRVMCTRLTV